MIVAAFRRARSLFLTAYGIRHSNPYTPTLSHTHPCNHTHAYSRAHTYAPSLTNARANTHTHTHTRIDTDTRTDIDIATDVYTYMHIQKDAYLFTYTHAWVARSAID